ncbi:Type IV leader peptidase family protein [Treponema sp. JC4]|uniref:prepilin peptidase n=1 Tax=Treponema sp. JC4 TaxID=1124982 RepID=UPI00025B0C4D|nr:prepilin peptidase [Treponema sp. JC4]EID85187.1 Type IV leader peptidase family protein [Treponema sp. JC4]
MLTILRLSLIFITCAILSFQDIRYKKISVPVLAAAYILQLIILCFASIELLIPHLINSAAFFLFYLFQSRFLKGKLGFGDILLAAFSGLSITNWEFLWVALIIPPISALIFALFFYIYNHKIAGVRIPFIPFMSLGLILTLLLESFF